MLFERAKRFHALNRGATVNGASTRQKLEILSP
jgi:hypothetical protein